jgi:hypothetical protein
VRAPSTMKNRNKKLTGLICALALLIFVVITINKYSRNPIIESIENHPEFAHLGLETELKEWIRSFGSPHTVDQIDGENTYFYWPDRGFAVFTHPHFAAQHRKLSRESWKVTSIIVPLKYDILPLVESRFGKIRFNKLLSLLIDHHQLTSSSYRYLLNEFKYSRAISSEKIDLSNSFFQLFPSHRSRIYVKSGEIEQIEIRDMNIFVRYD